MSDVIFRDLAKFEKYIPTAAGSDTEDLKPFLQETEIWIKELLGEKLYAEIIRLSGLPPEEQKKIVENCELVICLKSYLSGIPFLDLVQTPNGFAVVSNTNQVPASKERVDRLLKSVQRRLTQALDVLLIAIFKENLFREMWSKSHWFDWYTETVYLTSSDVRMYTGKEISFLDFEKLHPYLLDHQNEICRFISRDYFDELVTKRRNADLSKFDKRVWKELRVIIGMKLQELNAYKMIENLINYMITHESHFPTYIASVEYKLKIEKKYKNRKQDSTFFFGG